MKNRDWFAKTDTLEPLRWKSPARFRAYLLSDITDECLSRVLAAIALCPQHSFVLKMRDTERLRAILRERITPQTAPGAQTGHKDVMQFTDAFMASWEYRVSCQISIVAGESTDRRFDYGASRSRREYHKLIDTYHKRHREWWPLSNVLVEEESGK